MGEERISFQDLLENGKQWTDFNSFIEEAPKLIADDVQRHVKEETELIRDIRAHPDFKKFEIRTISEKQLDEAEKLLASGKVVGIDGTISKYHLFSGVRCQIGVIAANYMGDKIHHSFFISQASHQEKPADAMERLMGRLSANRISDLHLSGLMSYREREAGLNEKFQDSFIMFHGSLIPFEMISGLGAMRALPLTLELMRKVITEKRFFSILSTTKTYEDYRTLGKAMEKGQYMLAKNFTVGEQISTNGRFMKENKWREDELEEVEKFLRECANKIRIGVIKVGEKPYVFQAHEDNFDLAAAIIARDSMFQKEKGFPLLIDYVDTMCSRYFTSSDFKKQVIWELAKTGEYITEASERELRVK